MLEGLLNRFAAWYRTRPNWGRTIGRNEDPYLHRYKLLKTKRYSLFLHHIVRSDHDYEVHDHPWGWAIALILVGGYIEERLSGDRRYLTRHTFRPGALNRLLGTTFHRLTLPPGASAWTLFFHGPRSKAWGFLDTGTMKYTVAERSDERLEVQG